MSRQRARELALSDNELVMARNELDSLHDDLFVLSCAVADTKRDLAGSRLSAAELKDTVLWLLEAAEPLAARRIAPAG